MLVLMTMPGEDNQHVHHKHKENSTIAGAVDKSKSGQQKRGARVVIFLEKNRQGKTGKRFRSLTHRAT